LTVIYKQSPVNNRLKNDSVSL